MSPHNQQPYPVQGDSLPEPTVAELRWLLQGETTDHASKWKPSSPLPTSRLAALLSKRLEAIRQEVDKEWRRAALGSPTSSVRLNGLRNLLPPGWSD